MSDKWMNLGYDNQDLKPYCEPTPDFKDERRIGEHLCLSPSLHDCYRYEVSSCLGFFWYVATIIKMIRKICLF